MQCNTISIYVCYTICSLVDQIQLIPKTDTLLITTEKNATLYVLEADQFPDIRKITRVCIISVDKESPVDSIAGE